jgi:hypothetical protein
MPWGRCGLWPVMTRASLGQDNRCPKHPEALEFQRDDSGLLSCRQFFWDLFHGAASASWPGYLSSSLSLGAPPVSDYSCTLAVKLTCFLSTGYLESKAVVVIEICGWSDALLLLWDGRGTTVVGFSGRHALTKTGRGTGRSEVKMGIPLCPHSLALVYQKCG